MEAVKSRMVSKMEVVIKRKRMADLAMQGKVIDDEVGVSDEWYNGDVRESNLLELEADLKRKDTCPCEYGICDEPGGCPLEHCFEH